MPNLPPNRARALALAGCALALAGCGAQDEVRGQLEQGYPERRLLLEAPTEAPSFVEVGALFGVYDLVPGWGVSWNDFDGDGDPDLFVANHMHFPSTLYVNHGGRYFTQSALSLGVDVGLDDHIGVWADYDGDGDVDLYTASGYYRPDHLLRNDGAVHFADATHESKADLGMEARGYSALWSDFTGDGWTDLLVLNLHTPDLYYRNLGDGTFAEDATAAGIGNSFGKEGAVAGDFDGDGDVDLYVPLLAESERNLLYLNRGDGTFVERSSGSGADLPGVSRGSAVGDYDGDGDLDIYVTQGRGQGDVLLRNRGDATFDDTSTEAGISVVSSGVRNAGFADLDNDGDLDIYVTCGGSHDDVDSPNVLLRNRGDGTFEDVTERANAGGVSSGNTAAAAFGDYNGDGFLDIAVTNGTGARAISGSNLLLRNRGLPQDGRAAGFWIRVLPERVQGSREGHGARVRVRLPGGRVQVRESGNMRTMSQDEAGAHLGLGSAGFAEDVAVSWPDGSASHLQGVPANGTLLLVPPERPRYVESHPAALLGLVPPFSLEAVELEVQARLADGLPSPSASEVARRRESILAYALGRDIANAVTVSDEEVAADYRANREQYRLPMRFWLEQIALGRFTMFRKQPRLPWPLAREVAAGLRQGRDAMDLMREFNLRAWASVARSEGRELEPDDEPADDTMRGYLETGWLTPAMLEERFGSFSATLMKTPIGGVQGPRPMREGRDVQDPDRVWPLVRSFRMKRKHKPAIVERDMVAADIRRHLRALELRSALLEAGSAHTGGFPPAGPVRQAFIESTRYDIGPLAAAARSAGLDHRPDVAAALERAAREASLDAAVAELVRRLPATEEDLAIYIADRADDWTRPARVRARIIFVSHADVAEEIRTRLDDGAAFEQVVEDFEVPPVRERSARSGIRYYVTVVLDEAHTSRRLGPDVFATLRGIPPGGVSQVIATRLGFNIVLVEEQLPAEPLPPEQSAHLAERELRRLRSERLVDELLSIGR